jgi:hypothetical protein
MGDDLFYREFEIDERVFEIQSRKVDLSFSSEVVVQRWFGQEILSHKEGAIVKGRMHSMLFGHDKMRIVGPVKNVKYDDGRGRGTGHFDETDEGELALKRVQSGSLRGVSVGYSVLKFKKLAPGEEYELAGGKIRGPKEEENNPIYIAEKWAPMEISLTPIPADHTVGIGREATRSLDGIEIEDLTIPDPVEDRKIEDPDDGANKGGEKEMDEKELQKKIEEAINARDAAHKETLKKVFDRASAVGLEGKAFELLVQGKTPEEITDALFTEIGKQRGKPGDGGDLDLNKKPLLDAVDDDTLARALSEPVLMNLT